MSQSLSVVAQSLADQVAELEDRVAELEREIDILRSERGDDPDYERGDDDEPSPVQELESVELLRELAAHLNGPRVWSVQEWHAHLKLLVHRAGQLIEEYDAR